MATPREVLVTVLQDVDEGQVPDDLREVAFAKLFDLRAGTVATGRGGPPNVVTPAPAGTGGGPQSQEPGGNGDLVAAIAARLKIEPGTVSEVFAAHDGDLELIVSARRLSGRVATATKEIALLIAGGRQAAGLEEWTSWDEIRRWCGEFKKLDSGNFAKTMREMDDLFNTRKESDRKLQVRLAKPGWERAADEIRRLGGE